MGILKWLFKKKSDTSEIYESKWVIKLDESSITSLHYSGEKTIIEKSNVAEIHIETNDQGPWSTDVLWVIYHGQGVHKIPQGATGEQSLLEWTQSLDGFDNAEFLKAMQSTDNKVFICWKRIAQD